MGSRRIGSHAGRAAGIAIVAIAFSVLTAKPVEAADFWCWLFGGCGGGQTTADETTTSPQNEAPEIDPRALANAIALAAGGAAMLGGRVRRRR